MKFLKLLIPWMMLIPLVSFSQKTVHKTITRVVTVEVDSTVANKQWVIDYIKSLNAPQADPLNEAPQVSKVTPQNSRPTLNSFPASILDMHELRLSVDGFIVSDLAPNTAEAYGKRYHSFYLIMDEDETVRSTFQNVDLSAYEGQVIMIRKFMVDVSFAPDYATFVANYWRIGRYNSDNYLLQHSQAFIKF